ncbi:hypothetical protein TNCV_1217811 [Trichonephila clavipes]|nr:hypothetical protein TNCV_1217811 [Trichonephila clavipes]
MKESRDTSFDGHIKRSRHQGEHLLLHVQMVMYKLGWWCYSLGDVLNGNSGTSSCERISGAYKRGDLGPPKWPNRYLIEYITAFIEKQLRDEIQSRRNISILRDHCLDIWYNLSQVIYQEFVASMPRRVALLFFWPIVPQSVIE